MGSYLVGYPAEKLAIKLRPSQTAPQNPKVGPRGFAHGKIHMRAVAAVGIDAQRGIEADLIPDGNGATRAR